MPRLGLLAIVIFLFTLATVVSPAEAMNPIMMQYICRQNCQMTFQQCARGASESSLPSGRSCTLCDSVLTRSVSSAHGAMRGSPRRVRDELLIASTPYGARQLDRQA